MAHLAYSDLAAPWWPRRGQERFHILFNFQTLWKEMKLPLLPLPLPSNVAFLWLERWSWTFFCALSSIPCRRWHQPLPSNVQHWMKTVIPLTHNPVVRVAPVGVDTTKLCSKSFIDTPILSMNTWTRKVWVLSKSYYASAGTEWIENVPMMTMASWTTSSIVATYILPYSSSLIACIWSPIGPNAYLTSSRCNGTMSTSAKAAYLWNPP